jgi:hypothetical protein
MVVMASLAADIIPSIVGISHLGQHTGTSCSGGLATNSSFNDTVARLVHETVFPMVQYVCDGDFETKGEGATL